jgi:16S rRNA (cytosine967-C5)-methyltransferase
VRLVTLDLIGGAPFGPVFDLVLVDAPCTGLGTIRRDVDIRWRQSTAGVSKAAGDQRRMLDEAARMVVVGGRLVYATCSSEPDENQDVVARFLETHHDYAQASRADIVNGGVPEAVVGPDGALVTRPDLHGLEAFFAVALDRRR